MIENKQLDTLIDKVSRIPYITLHDAEYNESEGYYHLQFHGPNDVEMKVVFDQTEQGEYLYDYFCVVYGKPTDIAFETVDVLKGEIFTWTGKSTSFSHMDEDASFPEKCIFHTFAVRGSLK